MAQASDRGLRREINEDSVLARYPIYAVADGMGGHEAGEVASRICVESLADNQDLLAAGDHISPEHITQALMMADSAIRAATDERAGTTVSGAVLVRDAGMPQWLIFNLGDSRTYRLGKGGLERVTVDHSEVQELMDLGHITAEEAQYHPRRHVVTRALGLGTENSADFWLLPVTDGDRILICSDGLTGELGDDRIAEILSADGDPERTCTDLIRAALQSGGRDNVSVVVLDAASVTGPVPAQ
ncbi:PP2C family protein-serine/threonine phosphatase [Paenarthrobacter sp. Z7-10]|uniref:PP2C family protein-serine/threonine phosphatase n=1 Tax=Paenarthrobacter sp. Z7-10 TaxID=2787635 RepID=UPI0022A97090|nr:protein phosphatase 2C domain-containing protein [Paenarthrobacter sp. Z7-10]